MDLEYPCTLHDAHLDLTFCPATRISHCGNTKILLASLESKHKYLLYLATLLLAFDHSLQLVQTNQMQLTTVVEIIDHVKH